MYETYEDLLNAVDKLTEAGKFINYGIRHAVRYRTCLQSRIVYNFAFATYTNTVFCASTINKLKDAKNNVKDARHTKLVDYPIYCFKYDKNDWHHHDEQTLSHINYNETQIIEFTTIRDFIKHVDRVLMDAHTSYAEYKTESMLHAINQL